MARFRVVQVITRDPLMSDQMADRLTSAGIELVVAVCANQEDLVRHAGDADVVWVLGDHRLLRGDNLDALPHCGAILRSGAGTDDVDVTGATQRGILVVNTPQVVTEAVADHAISLLFSLVRQVSRQDRLVRRGEWSARLAMPGRRFSGAALGFVGFGRIPRLMTRKLAGFGMRFLGTDPSETAEEMARHGVTWVRLDELLAQADYVSLHCPLTQATRHLIGESALRQMQPHALLVNTARGAVVDEQALIRALQEGWIAGAALDVLDQEPPALSNPLLRMEHVIITPHVAGYSDTYPQEFLEGSVEALIDLAQGRLPRSVVNPGVIPRWRWLRRAMNLAADAQADPLSKRERLT